MDVAYTLVCGTISDGWNYRVWKVGDDSVAIGCHFVDCLDALASLEDKQ